MLLIIIIILIISLYIFNYKLLLEGFKNTQTFKPVFKNNPIKLARYQKKHPNPDIQSNIVYSANLQQINKQSNIKSIYNPKFTEKFNVKIDQKYKLYGEDNLNFKKAGIIKQPTDIDQTTNINIMNLTNNSMNKTIKDIYDDITNDNRNTNMNLDNLLAYDPLDNYNIDTKYGSTQFDTYSMNNIIY